MTVATASVSVPSETARTFSPLPADSPIVSMPEALLQQHAAEKNASTTKPSSMSPLEDCEQTQTTSPTTMEDEDEIHSQASLSFRESMRRDSGAPPCCASSSSSSASEDIPEEQVINATAQGDDLEPSELLEHATLKPHGGTPPVIKPYLLEQVPVNNKRWLSLKLPPCPKLQQTKLTRSQSEPAVNNDQAQPRRVSFLAVHIREYEQTIGDNPSVGYGPPISLDWNYQSNEPIMLEDFEANRGSRRSLRQMMMNYYHRTNVLSYGFGYSESELVAAHKAAEKIKGQRAMTKALLGVSKLEEVWQSTKRKTKRLGRKSSE